MFKLVPIKRQTILTSPPTHCDLCNTSIERDLIDGQTTSGSWAWMCMNCAQKFATGIGQVYYKFKDGKFRKIRSS